MARTHESSEARRARELEIAQRVSKTRGSALHTTRDVPRGMKVAAASGCDIDGARAVVAKTAADAGSRRAEVVFDHLSAGGVYHFNVVFPGMYTQTKICSVVVDPTLEPPATFVDSEDVPYNFTDEGLSHYAEDQKMALASPTRTFCVRNFVEGKSQLQVIGKYANGDQVTQALKVAGFATKPISMNFGLGEEILCLPMYADAAIATCKTAGVLSVKRAAEHASRELENLKRMREDIEAALAQIDEAVKSRKKEIETQEYGKFFDIQGLGPLDKPGLDQEKTRILDELFDRVREARTQAIQFADDQIATIDLTSSGSPAYAEIVKSLDVKYQKLKGWSETLSQALARYTKKSVTEKLVMVTPEKYPDTVKHRETVEDEARKWESQGIDVKGMNAVRKSESVDELAPEYELLGVLTSFINDLSREGAKSPFGA